jgi:hypothetical protein
LILIVTIFWNISQYSISLLAACQLITLFICLINLFIFFCRGLFLRWWDISTNLNLILVEPLCPWSVFNPLWIMYHIGKPRAKVHSEVQIFVFCASVFALHKSLYSGTTIKYNKAIICATLISSRSSPCTVLASPELP